MERGVTAFDCNKLTLPVLANHTLSKAATGKDMSIPETEDQFLSVVRKALQILHENLQLETFLFKTYFISPNGKRHSSIKVFSSIKHWFAIPKNLGFKVLNHMLHYFSENTKRIC